MGKWEQYNYPVGKSQFELCIKFFYEGICISSISRKQNVLQAPVYQCENILLTSAEERDCLTEGEQSGVLKVFSGKQI